MSARWKLILGVASVLVVALAASAMASKTFFTATKGKTSIFLALKSGSKQKIVDFSWDGLKCGSDRFTAGLHDAIKVKNDGSFNSEQAVAGAADGVQIAAKVKGQVGQRVAKVTGKLKLTGDCETTVDFKATESAG
jgi:hypothetical protein